MMLKRNVVFVPTLAAPYQIVQAGEAKGVPAFAVEKSLRVMDAHQRSFEWALSAGVTIAAGNDGGCVPRSGVAEPYSLHFASLRRGCCNTFAAKWN